MGGVGGPPTLLVDDLGTAPLVARSVFLAAVGATFGATFLAVAELETFLVEVLGPDREYE